MQKKRSSPKLPNNPNSAKIKKIGDEKMAKTYINTVKYLVKIKFEIDGIVDKPDIVGAIFGQSEGLLGDEMDLKELQKNGKLGRIEINLATSMGRTKGEVLVPSSMDMAETSLLAAGIESVDKVGPCEAKLEILDIEDTRNVTRKEILQSLKKRIKASEEVAEERGYRPQMDFSAPREYNPAQREHSSAPREFNPAAPREYNPVQREFSGPREYSGAPRTFERKEGFRPRMDSRRPPMRNDRSRGPPMRRGTAFGQAPSNGAGFERPSFERTPWSSERVGFGEGGAPPVRSAPAVMLSAEEEGAFKPVFEELKGSMKARILGENNETLKEVKVKDI